MNSPAATALDRLAGAGAGASASASALAGLRREAAEAWRAADLPTTKLEDWRFTSLAALEAREPGAPSADVAIDPALLGAATDALPGPAVVFVDGFLRPEHQRGEIPAGVSVASVPDLLRDDAPRLARHLGACAADPKARALWALNTACLSGGALVEIAAGAQVADPLRLLFVQTGATVAAQPRVLVHAAAGSRACLIEHFASTDGATGFTNALSELRLERGARLEHVSLQCQGRGTIHVAGVASRQEQGSELRTHSVALGSDLARVDVHSVLEGAGAHIYQGGLYLADGRRHIDHHTTIDHAVAQTTSRELYKGVLDDRGRGVFHGRIHVRPDAQRIAAEQTNRALLLSDHARINTKPQLEIHADDVKCSHGATIGQLDDTQLFYLRSRGIPLAQARALLTWAFAREAVDAVDAVEAPGSEALRDWLAARVQDWMPLHEGTPQ